MRLDTPMPKQTTSWYAHYLCCSVSCTVLLAMLSVTASAVQLCLMLLGMCLAARMRALADVVAIANGSLAS